MRRIFEDQQGNQVAQFDLWNYDYDARTRRWYLDTIETDRPLKSGEILLDDGSHIALVSVSKHTPENTLW